VIEQQQPEATQLGEQYHLGSLLETYRVEYSRESILVFRLLMTMMLLVTIAGCSVIGSLVLFKTHIPYYFTFLLTLLLAVLNIPLYRLGRNKKVSPPVPYNPSLRNLRVYIYENGLVRLRSRKPEVILWNKMKHVQRIPLNRYDIQGTRPFLNIRLTNGKLVSFIGNFPNITALGDAIEREYLKGHEGA